MSAEVETLRSDLAALQARLLLAGLDGTLPSEAASKTDDKAAADDESKKAKPADKAASGETSRLIHSKMKKCASSGYNVGARAKRSIL